MITRLPWLAHLTGVGAVVAGLAGSSAVIWHSSYAAFSTKTTNGASALAAGNVAISDDDAGSVLLNASNLKPGSTGTGCINVSYTGSLAANVRLYGTLPTGTLAPYVNLTVDEGTAATGGAGLSCTGFSLTSNLFSGTMDNFGTTKTSFATGVSTWAPTGAATASRSYRMTWTVQDDNNAQGKSAGLTFTWESQNS